MERTLRAVLRADVGSFESDMRRAATATESVGQAAQSAARQTQRSTREQTSSARSFSQRLVESARENERAWTQVGKGLTAAGAATTGLMTVVANTGIQYNSLRQVATQALTAVTGSAEEAADQMARMDEFGSTSWLMRDSIIRAQQQMTGFGIETSKVVGYMDALQEAVAAAGGDSQTFEELAYLMGQIESQSKITAQELNQFGQRGVDAAQMIGDAMGYTAGEIRDQITAGTLDASVALDALAQGMMMNFEGSSDLVRDTFRGAVDDVKAAFRDLSAISMSWLVDPEGGGVLTDMLGRLADTMFTLRDTLPPAVLQIGGALTGLGGLATLAAGGLMMAVPKLVEFQTSLQTLATIVPRAAAGIGMFVGAVGRLAGAAGIIGAVTVAVSGLSRLLHTEGVPQDLHAIAASVRDIADAGGDLSSIEIGDIFSEMPTWGFDRVTIESENLRDALDRLNDPGLTGGISKLFGDLFGAPSWMHDTADAVAIMDQALADMVNSGNVELVQELLGSLSAQDLEHMPQVTAALEAAGAAGVEAADGITYADAAAAAAAESLAELTAAGEAAATAFLDLGAAFDVEDWTVGSVTEHIQEQIAALSEYGDNIGTITDRLNDLDLDGTGLANFLDSLDPATAAAFADELAGVSDVEFTNLVDSLNTAETAAVAFGEAAAAAFAEWLGIDIPPVEVDVDDGPARSGFETLVDDFNNAPPGIVSVNADTGRAEVEINGFMVGLSDQVGFVTIDGNTQPGNVTLGQFVGDVDEATGTVDIEGHSLPAEMTLWQLIALIDGEYGTTDILGNDDPAISTVQEFLDWVNYGTSSTIPVGANDSAARATVRGTLEWIRNQSARITVTSQHAGLDQVRAAGGPIHGPGTGTSDSIPAIGPGGTRYRLSNNEHVWTAYENQMVGGHGAMYQLRSMARTGALRALLNGHGYATGGGIPAQPTRTFVTNYTAPAAATASTVAPGPSAADIRSALDGVRVHLTGTENLADGVAGTLLTEMRAH